MLNYNVVYSLCNKHNWFTRGTNDQYEKMFQMVREGKSIHDIALVIWVCSDGKDSLKDIQAILRENYEA